MCPDSAAINPEEQQRQDLEEIRRLGLDARAQHEFTTRVPNAKVKEWGIGFFGIPDSRAVVWCNILYTVGGGSEVQQKEFGFKKMANGKWDLIWHDPNVPEAYKLGRKESVKLGSFELTTPRIVISDPGYYLDTVKTDGLGAVVAKCRVGTWKAEVIIKHFKKPKMSLTSELLTWHVDFKKPSALQWQKQKHPIGADYGQAGIYDLAHFHDDGIVPETIEWTVGHFGPADESDLWYSYCCELTTHNPNGSVIPFGVVTNAGKGDGSYEYSLARDEKGAVIGVWIVFVDDQGCG
jgi:hypothetical protein